MAYINIAFDSRQVAGWEQMLEAEQKERNWTEWEEDVKLLQRPLQVKYVSEVCNS